MNPLHLSLRNCRTFDEIDLDLPEGLLAILGQNGAGKSTLINAIDVALFGPESRTLADWYPRGGGTDPLVITLTFESGGQTYRVRRSFSPKGRGTSNTDLERWYAYEDDRVDSWEPLTLESQSATEDLIEQLVGLSRDTFRASSFLAQGDAGRFCEAAPRQRKAILADVMGLGEWDERLERARTEKRAAESELDRIAGSLERAEAELAERSLVEQERAEAVEQRTVAEASLSEAVAGLATAREALAEAERDTERRAGAEKELQDAERSLSELEEGIEALTMELREIDRRLYEREGLETLAAGLPGLVAEQEALAEQERVHVEGQRLVADRERLRARQDELIQKRQDLVAKREAALGGIGSETCDRCGSVLNEELARRAADSYAAEAEVVNSQANALHAEAVAAWEALLALSPATPPPAPDPVRARQVADLIRLGHDAQTKLAALAEVQQRGYAAVTEIEKMRAGLSEREQAVGAARARVQGLGPHDLGERGRCSSRVRHWEEQEALERRTLSSFDADIARADAQIERLDKIAADILSTGVRRDELHAELDLLTHLERACGPNGVPALILETIAIPQVEVEASRILGLLGGPAYACELRTLREKKSGGLADTLDVILLTETGEAPYESFSGGERARIAFALRLALAQLLASRKGSSTSLLVIDELEGLDAQGIAALVTVLEDLQRSIPRIVVVSHVSEMRDSFENCLVLEQIDGRSRVVGQVPA